MRLWAVGLVVAGVLATGGVAQAATWTVNNYADPTGGSCPLACSLRHAVLQSGAGDTIAIPAQNGLQVQLSQGTPILVSHALTITGDGADATTIDGSANRDGQNRTNRIFKVTGGGDLQLGGVTLQNGGDENDETCQSGCSSITATGGGALYVDGSSSAELSGVRLVGDSASIGGAIASAGTLDLADVTFSRNGAAFGGGLFVRGGTATVRRSTFDQNGSGGSVGGAAFVYGGRLDLWDSTVANDGNPSSIGGGLENYGGTMTLANVTLAGNMRGAIETDAGASTTVTNTLIGAGFDDGGDFACVPAGINRDGGKKSVAAITTDGGHNLDEDGQCGLTGAGDLTGDAHLAPLADNGATTPTMALLHGSPALDAGDDTACARIDHPTDGPHCDIGAFEAVRLAPPASATTQPATDIGSYGATLHATVDLSGEAGGAHFVWGPAEDDLSSVTGVGASGTGTTAALPLGGLQPNTTYYFRAVADNASDQRPADNVQHFTTAAAPPTVTPPEASGIDDTSATLSFVITTGGADTSYVIEYGPDAAYGQSTAPVDIGAEPQEQQLTARLTGLKPGSTYHIDIVATNSSAPDGVDSGDSQFDTDPQVSGGAGAPLTVTDRHDNVDFCPDSAQVDWGDGSPVGTAPVTCDNLGSFSATATHAYAAPGRYRIRFGYGGDVVAQQWAVIAAPEQATPTATPQATPTPTPTPTPTATPTPPAPVFHQQVVVKPISGTVLVRLKGTKTFVPVDATTGVPLGSQVDVTHGRIQLTSVPRPGAKPQTAVFYGGIFTVTQPGAITDLALSGPKPTCAPRGRASAAAKKKKVKSRSLWGDGHGSFRTRGTYSAATVRGTDWLVRDTCAGTLTRVVRGVVSVRDNVRHRTRLLRAGQHYLARPRKR